MVAFFVGLHSCKTDFEVNAPWKDITVVYGLLDQNENGKQHSLNESGKVHIIKINKAFLGKADANDMAAIADSSEYGPEEITAEIQRSKNGGPPDQTYVLTRFVDPNKPSGTFYSGDQVLYKFSDSLLPGYDYTLVVTNTKTKKKVLAKTQIVQDFKFASGGFWNAPTPKVSFFNNGSYEKFDKVFWKTAVNGRRYQLTVRFHYREKDFNKSGNPETEKTLDWTFASVQSQDLNGGDEIGREINGEDFYKYIATQLEPFSLATNNVIRCVGTLDFIVSAAGEDFNTYLEVNEPSTGIVQERPEYTNVFDENGSEQAGFFSSRYSIIEEGAKLGQSGLTNSLSELKSGIYTGNHGFATAPVSTCPAY